MDMITLLQDLKAMADEWERKAEKHEASAKRFAEQNNPTWTTGENVHAWECRAHASQLRSRLAHVGVVELRA